MKLQTLYSLTHKTHSVLREITYKHIQPMSYSAILFNKEHVKSLEYEKRLPPTSIGARRIRPSSTNVLKEMKRQKRLKKEQQEGESQIMESSEKGSNSQQEGDTMCSDISNNDSLKMPMENNNNNPKERQYFQLKVDQRHIQEEIDEIRGTDRSAYHNLPVILTPEMTMEAEKHRLLMSNPMSNQNKVSKDNYYLAQLSDSLTEQWIQALQQEITRAELIRSKEPMRPMAYKLAPEKWTRLCPLSTSQPPSEGVASVQEMEHDAPFTIKDGDIIKIQGICNELKTSWKSQTRNIVFDYLYNTYPSLEMADGAKFGCDFLLYDGSRKNRHAFGGIRILTSNFKSFNGPMDIKAEFQIPSAFDLHGYVRALNTAGKLALLATAVHNDVDHTLHVAVIDLALEKVLTAPTHQKRNRSEVRKEVGKHLAKKQHLG